MPSTISEDVGAHGPEDPDAARRAMSRRRLIRNAGIAGAAAWTAPVIIDSLASPAAAATCPAGKFAYAVLYSPPGSNGQLFNRPGGDDVGGSGPGQTPMTTCDFTDPGDDCLHTNAAAVLTTWQAIGLEIVPTNISHNINTLSQANVKLTLDSSSCCKITSVRAHVHRFGDPTGNATEDDCPPSYCQKATDGGTYFRIVDGAYCTKSVTVSPRKDAEVCFRGSDPTAEEVHWGSPNQDCACQSAPNCSGNGYTNGQPYGYMIIELDCRGDQVTCVPS